MLIHPPQFDPVLPRRGPWMQLFTGASFDLDAPAFRGTQDDLINIGMSLAFTQRFTGHAIESFPIAEHVCLVDDIACELAISEGMSHLQVKAVRRKAFGHDFHEAYTGDLSSPLKQMFELLCPGIIARLVDPIDKALFDRFDIESSPEIDRIVKKADEMSLWIERRTNLNPSERPWGWDPQEPPGKWATYQIKGLDRMDAYNLFMSHARALDIH